MANLAYIAGIVEIYYFLTENTIKTVLEKAKLLKTYKCRLFFGKYDTLHEFLSTSKVAMKSVKGDCQLFGALLPLVPSAIVIIRL